MHTHSLTATLAELSLGAILAPERQSILGPVVDPVGVPALVVICLKPHLPALLALGKTTTG
jgi:hypothetical protein